MLVCHDCHKTIDQDENGLPDVAEDAPPDEYDLIEWIAQQPWCDGNVGMFGISQFGAAQTRAAIQQPPHLKAIAPIEFHLDLYRDLCYHGGVHAGFGHELYNGGGAFTSGWAPRNVVSEMMTRKSKEEFDRLENLIGRKKASILSEYLKNLP